MAGLLKLHRVLLPACLLFACALHGGETLEEKTLTGEFKGRIQFSSPLLLAVKYGASLRQGGVLSVPGGSRVSLQSGGEDPAHGTSSLLILGILNLYGTESKYITVQSLNSGRIVIGDTSQRDNLKPRPSLIGCSIRYVVFINTPLVVRDGTVAIDNCVFVNSPVEVDGGKAAVTRSTFVNPAGTGLEVTRSDKYPTVLVKGCSFTGCAVGFSIKLGTMRQQRAQLAITECNFIANGSHIFYEDLNHFPLTTCHIAEPAPTDQTAFSYPIDEAYKGRLIPQGLKKSPVKLAGSTLIDKGIINPSALLPASDGDQAAQPAEPQPDAGH
ncbi:MAG: hypothetical protein JW909_11475 [Planctomycetes bacterium]|nr:hypothetical protein [Planctomycetota bacterium]